ncbi:hypothetical protein BJX70DRAFT_364200 [Aspergillus crustosus]
MPTWHYPPQAALTPTPPDLSRMRQTFLLKGDFSFTILCNPGDWTCVIRWVNRGRFEDFIQGNRG